MGPGRRRCGAPRTAQQRFVHWTLRSHGWFLEDASVRIERSGCPAVAEHPAGGSGGGATSLWCRGSRPGNVWNSVCWCQNIQRFHDHGCWSDCANRIMAEGRDDEDWGDWKKCFQEARNRNKQLFGVQNGSQCWLPTGNHAIAHPRWLDQTSKQWPVGNLTPTQVFVRSRDNCSGPRPECGPEQTSTDRHSVKRCIRWITRDHACV